MKSEGIEHQFDQHEMESWLGPVSEIRRNSMANALFVTILMNQIKPYYKQAEFEPPGMFEVLMSPIYGELHSIDNKEKKIIVKLYFDRKIEICDDNEKLKEICHRMASLTDGNFKIYSKGELKYIY